MKEEQIHIPLRGSMAFARLWHVRGDAAESSRGLILMLHGAGEHSLRYQDAALFFAHQGFNVAAYDLRGHGYSAVSSAERTDRISLKRKLYEYSDFGHLSTEQGWQILVDDFQQVLEYLSSRYGDVPLFVFGHQLGGMIVRAALSMLPDQSFSRIHGVILSGQLVKPGRGLTTGSARLGRAIRRSSDDCVDPIFSRRVIRGFLTPSGSSADRTDLEWMSSLSDEVDRYMADPLCGAVLRLGMYKAIFDLSEYLCSRLYRKSIEGRSLPVFIVSGDRDVLGNKGKAVKAITDSLSRSGWQRVKQSVYPLARHDLLHDVSRGLLLNDMLEWCASYCSPVAISGELQRTGT